MPKAPQHPESQFVPAPNSPTLEAENRRVEALNIAGRVYSAQRIQFNPEDLITAASKIEKYIKEGAS